MVFSKIEWQYEHVIARIWQGIQDYNQIAWYDLVKSLSDDNLTNGRWFKEFDSTWRRNRVLCVKLGKHNYLKSLVQSSSIMK